jgi:uroporphyrinogen-III synthase
MTRLLVTRPAHQADALVEALAAHGIGAAAVPTVALLPGPNANDLDAILGSLGDNSWLVITSVNGADVVLDRLRGRKAGLPASTRLAAVGPATAAALQAGGLRVDHVPREYRTVAIADGLGDLEGVRVALARADAATPELADTLRARGAVVEEVVAYRVVEAPRASRALLDAAIRQGIDGVTFTSGSTVRGLVKLAGATAGQPVTELPAYCIGPVTAQVARAAGFEVAVVAAEHTISALAEAIAGHLAKEMA